MASTNIPQLPPTLKPIQHYLKTAAEHDRRDPVVAYYCRLYAMQRGMEIDKKSPDCRVFLVSLMDSLEKVKSANQDDALHSEVVGQAHMENYALKVFLFADNEDRAARFDKNVVKSFYTAGMLFDVLTVFGELSEDIDQNKKYAKWKAAYIHKCLKNNETPIAGPLPDDDDGPGLRPSENYGMNVPEVSGFDNEAGREPASGYIPPGGFDVLGPARGIFDIPSPNNHFPSVPTCGAHAPPSTPQDQPQPTHQPQTPASYGQQNWNQPASASGTQLTPQQYQKAMKLCKYASSALQYEDSKTAIDNLQKALTLLTTGQDS